VRSALVIDSSALVSIDFRMAAFGRTSLLVALFLFADALLLVSAGQQWTAKTIPNGPASGRVAPQSVVIHSENLFWFQGGTDNAGVFQGDTWSMFLNNLTWTARPCKGTTIGVDCPYSRSAGFAAWISSTREVFIWGGNEDPDQITSDPKVWLYNLDTNTWVAVTAANTPENRESGIAAYDVVNNRVIIHGGLITSSQSTTSETWGYYVANQTWVNLTSQTVNPPPPRYQGVGGFVAKKGSAGYLLLFGGRNLVVYYNDVWALDLATLVWTNRTYMLDSSYNTGSALVGQFQGQPQVEPRRRAGASYDTAGNFYLFGGSATGFNTTQCPRCVLQFCGECVHVYNFYTNNFTVLLPTTVVGLSNIFSWPTFAVANTTRSIDLFGTAGFYQFVPTGSCGDKIVQFPEQCDDQNAVAGDGCNNCRKEFCGDKVVNNNNTETCDDGNTKNGDWCDENCQTEACNNTVYNPGTEECETKLNVTGCIANCSCDRTLYYPDGLGGCTLCDWGQWSAFGTCSAICKPGGLKNRTHTQVNVTIPVLLPVLNGQKACLNTEYDQPFTICNDQVECPIDCEWGSWSSFSECSLPCFDGVNGTRSQNRSIAVEAQFGGANCSGSDINVEYCNTQPCPVNCSWNQWSNWTACTVDCGTGLTNRSRTKNDEKFGGLPCEGNATMSDVCNTQPCPIDCVWNIWSNWTQCTAQCGGGTQDRNRTFVAAKFGGKDCVGSPNMTQNCNTQCCPVDCTWGDWSPWNQCSVPCAGGIQNHTRVANGPVCNGKPCLGNTTQYQTCNTGICPTYCWNLTFTAQPGVSSFAKGTVNFCISNLTHVINWTIIHNISKPTVAHIHDLAGLIFPVGVTAVSPISNKNSPTTMSNAQYQRVCSGNAYFNIHSEDYVTGELEACMGINCVTGGFTPGGCNSAFAPTPVRPPPAPPGASPLPPTPSAIPCLLSAWSNFGPCSVACGGGVYSRTRAVVVNAQNGGPCGETVETRVCNDIECPSPSTFTDCQVSSWSSWGGCVCADPNKPTNGTQTRNKFIVVAPSAGGKACPPAAELSDSAACLCECLTCLPSPTPTPTKVDVISAPIASVSLAVIASALALFLHIAWE